MSSTGSRKEPLAGEGRKQQAKAAVCVLYYVGSLLDVVLASRLDLRIGSDHVAGALVYSKIRSIEYYIP
jgi:hypothetical protein